MIASSVIFKLSSDLKCGCKMLIVLFAFQILLSINRYYCIVVFVVY